MSITPPSESLYLLPGFDTASDYDSLIMDTCELLAQTDCHFNVGGFGEEAWPVDVAYDLSSVMEQTPAAIEALQEGKEAVIDLYGQGVERCLTFSPMGDDVEVRCHSGTNWMPRPDIEHVARGKALSLLAGLCRDFKIALERASPVLAETSPYADW